MGTVVYQIGDVVNFQVGNISCIGIVRDDLDDAVEVRTVEVHGRRDVRVVKILKTLICTQKG